MHEDADPHRVAEVIAGPRRGSGYRVGGTAILTAAHVVSGAAEVVVRCDAGMPGEWSATATVAWSDVDSDLAMLEFARPAGAPASVTPVRYGALADRQAVIEVHAAGFPRFKARKGASVYRDLHDFVGTVSVLANRRSGTLEVSVAVPPAADPDGLSPWEGMSGGRAVGAGPHHRRRRGTPPAGGPGPAVGGPRRQHDAGPGAARRRAGGSARVDGPLGLRGAGARHRARRRAEGPRGRTRRAGGLLRR